MSEEAHEVRGSSAHPVRALVSYAFRMGPQQTWAMLRGKELPNFARLDRRGRLSIREHGILWEKLSADCR
jgi:hypothetical protein